MDLLQHAAFDHRYAGLLRSDIDQQLLTDGRQNNAHVASHSCNN